MQGTDRRRRRGNENLPVRKYFAEAGRKDGVALVFTQGDQESDEPTYRGGLTYIQQMNELEFCARGRDNGTMKYVFKEK